MAMTRDEIRSLLTFYNALPASSVTKCRIAEAGMALRDGFELGNGPEDRAFERLPNYRGGNLTMRTFPKAFAMATKMYRDNPDTFVEVFGTEAEFLARNPQAQPPPEH